MPSLQVDSRDTGVIFTVNFGDILLFCIGFIACGPRSTDMRKLAAIVVLVSTFGCGNADNRLTGETVGLYISTVDEKNDAFRVQTVRWWYPGKRDAKHELECETGACVEWVIEGEISGSIVIRADASVVKEDDKHCWDLYAGEVVVEMPAREVTIVMAYVNTVCS